MKKENLLEQLKERVSTLEDAYKETGRPKVDFSVYPEDMRVRKQACYDGEILVEAARKIEREFDSGEINWDNYSQLKFSPIFNMSPSNFAFNFSTYGRSRAFAGGGSRLHVLFEESSIYIAKTFLEIWKKVQLG